MWLLGWVHPLLAFPRRCTVYACEIGQRNTTGVNRLLALDARTIEALGLLLAGGLDTADLCERRIAQVLFQSGRLLEVMLIHGA